MKQTDRPEQLTLTPDPDLHQGLARLHEIDTHPGGAGVMSGLVPYLAVPDESLTRLYVSPLFRALVPKPVGQGRLAKDHDRWRAHLHPQDRDSVLKVLQDSRERQLPYSLEYRLQDGDGNVRWVRDMGVYVKDPQRQDTVVQGVMMDVTRERELAARLKALESGRDGDAEAPGKGALNQLTRQMHDTLERAATGIYRLDAEGRITYANQAVLRLSGYDRATLLGEPAARRLHHAHGDTLTGADQGTAELIDALETATRHQALDATLWRANGRALAVRCNVVPTDDGGAVVTLQDATEHRSLATQLEYQATHDPLTGLFNRRELLIRLEQALHRARSRDREAGFLYIDMDQFRVINDTSGHAAGDELLRQLAALMTSYARPGDSVARLGGDEFAMILDDCTTSEALRHAEALRDRFADFAFQWEDKTYSVSTSIGIVPLNRESGNVISVMSAADNACNSAKDKGRNRVHMYKHDDTSLMRRQGEMQWVARIHQAVQDGCLSLFAQRIEPIGGEARGTAGGHLEMLIKMQDGQGGLIPPGVFLPAAERYNLSAGIDRWVVQHTFAWIVDENLDADRLALCAINLSGHSVGDPSFLDFVVAQLKRHALPADRICFEITETVAIANLTQARALMSKLGAMGCRFALDDFGSGMSSFGYLRSFPVDFLKIDGLFVKDIANDPTDLALVRSINDIAHVMGKRTIAEFVESKEILELLRDMGVDYAQGHYIAEPLPVADLRI